MIDKGYQASTMKQLSPEARSVKPSGHPGCEFFDEPLCGLGDPMGATFVKSINGYNFSVYTGSASSVTLCLFTEDDLNKGRTTVEIELDPALNRTGQVWHIALPRMDPTLLYGYRVKGPVGRPGMAPEGHGFDETKVVLDPYAKAIMGRREYGRLGPELEYGRPDVLGYGQTWSQSACVLPEAQDDFDWEGDRPLNIPMEELVIYEMHVRGFTQDPSSRVSSPGTYQGVVEKLDYLQSLGVNCIELLPVHEFNELEYYQIIPGTDKYRFNFWGYSTVNFFSPMARFSQAAKDGRSGNDVVREFKTMVREAHKRGIEVIMDVVFNHTAEGNHLGPTISFRGLDNRVYYMLAPKGETYNYSGCGNTFNCNHPVVRKFIVDCLKYWVEEMHVDGFRFDLASIMTRAPSSWHPTQPFYQLPASDVPPAFGPDGMPVPAQEEALPDGPITDASGYMTDGSGSPTGTPLGDPPLVAMISQDPVLANTKLIAEAWDCDGLNQVGAFPHYGGRWSEWNGTFRDTVRNFIKGMDGWVSPFASALLGSPEVYGKSEPYKEEDWWGANTGKRWRGGRGPRSSINFVTAHDGFTLRDLVSYNEKHNEANGEDNRDGETHNNSWNCGQEGETIDPKVVRLRQRQARNMMCALMVSQGVPMLLMGDEYGHTKGGNNNTYCHDSPINWFNWAAAKNELPVGKDFDSLSLLRFSRHLIHFRRTHPEFRQGNYLGQPKVEWHGIKPSTPDWTHESRFLAFTLTTEHPGKSGVFVAFNTSHLPVTVELPDWSKTTSNVNFSWVPVVDTSKKAPYDFLQPDAVLSDEEYRGQLTAMAPWLNERQYPMLPYSCIILEWRERPQARVVTPEAAARDIEGLSTVAPLPSNARNSRPSARSRSSSPNRSNAPLKSKLAAETPYSVPRPRPGAPIAPSQPPVVPQVGATHPPHPAGGYHGSAGPLPSVAQLSPAARAAFPLLTQEEVLSVVAMAEEKAFEMVAKGLIMEAQRAEARNVLYENALLKKASEKRK